MKPSVRLLAGPLGAAIFCIGVLVLAAMIPGYSHVHQTISEIGTLGTPMQMPFTVLLLCVAVCMWVFAWGVWDVSAAAGHNRFAAVLIACMGISAMGVGIFSTPHPLHNYFGLSEIVGYQAPLAFLLRGVMGSPDGGGWRVSYILTQPHPDQGAPEGASCR